MSNSSRTSKQWGGNGVGQKTTVAVAAAVGVASAIALYYFTKRRNDKKAAEDEEKSPEVVDVPKDTVQEKELQAEVKAESSVDSKVESPYAPKVESAPESAQEPKVETIPEPKVESIPEPKVESIPEPKVESIPEPKVESIPSPVIESIPKPAAESMPAKKSPTFVELYNNAKKLFNAQKYEEALDQFNKAIEASPENNSQMKTLVYSHASCLRKLNRLEEALADYTKCIELDPKYSRAYKARAAVEVSLDRPEAAMADFSYCYLLDIVSQGDMQPTPEGMDSLIQVLGKKDVEKEMERRRTDPTYVPTLPSKQFIAFYFSTVLSEKSDAYNPDHLSIEELTRRIEHYPEEGEKKTKGDLLLMRGGQLKSEKRYNEAFEDFKQAADATNGCSDLAAATLEKATFLNLCGDVSGARPLFESLYMEGNRSVNLLVKYASCLLELEDEKHKAVFDEAVTCNPTASDGYFHRGQMYFLENNVEKSMADLNKAVHLQPNFTIAHVQLGYCNAMSGNMEGAIACMKRALACSGNKAQAYNHFGELYMTMGRLGEAEDCFMKAQKADPRWAYAYVNQAVLALQKSQDCLTANSLLEKAIKVDPTCVNAYLQMAQLHMLLQEWDPTKEMLEKAFKEARTQNDLQQVCALQETVKYQLEAMEKYQSTLKNEK